MNGLTALGLLSDDEFEGLLVRADRLAQNGIPPAKPGRSVAGLFFNPSLRTRASLELATAALGSVCTTHDVGGSVWKLETRDRAVMDGDKAEHVRDAVGKFLSGVVDVIAVRCFADLDQPFEQHRADPVLAAIEAAAEVPVINLESAVAHPLQGLADVLTLRQRLAGPPAERTVAVTWAYHPRPLPMAVANSAVTGFARAGYRVRLVCPPGFELHADTLDEARRHAGDGLSISHDLDDGVDGADVIYAKSWGARSEYAATAGPSAREPFRDWIIDAERQARGTPSAFLHCLPVRRNVVVTDEVIDGPLSWVATQARNRLYVQAAALCELL